MDNFNENHKVEKVFDQTSLDPVELESSYFLIKQMRTLQRQKTAMVVMGRIKVITEWGEFKEV